MTRLYRVARVAIGVGAIVAALCLTPVSSAQNQTSQDKTGRQSPAKSSPQPAAPSAGDNGNPFPGNTANVPVLPSANTPALPPESSSGAEGPQLPLPGSDQDPVRSPDDVAPPAESGTQGAPGSKQTQWSSSLTGLGRLLPQPGDNSSGKKRRFGRGAAQPAPIPEETAPEDIRVGTYYLQTHDWKGALSRFESAMVLAPDDPEVYWGMAECDRHLGNFADARANYLKVLEYDPGSRHAKDARKALRDPEIANGKNAAP